MVTLIEKDNTSYVGLSEEIAAPKLMIYYTDGQFMFKTQDARVESMNIDVVKGTKTIGTFQTGQKYNIRDWFAMSSEFYYTYNASLNGTNYKTIAFYIYVLDPNFNYYSAEYSSGKHYNYSMWKYKYGYDTPLLEINGVYNYDKADGTEVIYDLWNDDVGISTSILDVKNNKKILSDRFIQLDNIGVLTNISGTTCINRLRLTEETCDLDELNDLNLDYVYDITLPEIDGAPTFYEGRTTDLCDIKTLAIQSPSFIKFKVSQVDTSTAEHPYFYNSSLASLNVTDDVKLKATYTFIGITPRYWNSLSNINNGFSSYELAPMKFSYNYPYIDSRYANCFENTVTTGSLKERYTRILMPMFGSTTKAYLNSKYKNVYPTTEYNPYMPTLPYYKLDYTNDSRIDYNGIVLKPVKEYTSVSGSTIKERGNVPISTQDASTMSTENFEYLEFITPIDCIAIVLSEQQLSSDVTDPTYTYNIKLTSSPNAYQAASTTCTMTFMADDCVYCGYDNTDDTRLVYGIPFCRLRDTTYYVYMVNIHGIDLNSEIVLSSLNYSIIDGVKSSTMNYNTYSWYTTEYKFKGMIDSRTDALPQSIPSGDFTIVRDGSSGIVTSTYTISSTLKRVNLRNSSAVKI